MKSFIKNARNGLNRIGRIQISSQLKNQNLYTDHFYEFNVDFTEIYTPGNFKNVNTYKLKIYCGNNNYFFTNINDIFYYKLTEVNNEKYLDIAVLTVNNYTNIHIDVKTEEPSSITFFNENATNSEYTRINYFSNLEGILHNASTSIYVGYNTDTKVRVKRGLIRISSLKSNLDPNISVIRDNSIYNADNEHFTVTIDETNDYDLLLNIHSKENYYYLIESL